MNLGWAVMFLAVMFYLMIANLAKADESAFETLVRCESVRGEEASTFEVRYLASDESYVARAVEGGVFDSGWVAVKQVVSLGGKEVAFVNPDEEFKVRMWGPNQVLRGEFRDQDTDVSSRLSPMDCR